MQLGPFEIVATIGEGAFGVVYRARRDGREVALKVMHAGEGEISPAEIARFVDEAEKMRRVVHPSLVSLEETGTLPDGRPFLSMPLLGDRSLAEQAASAPFAPARALTLFTGLARAVSALHQAGLIHRDIKPENVMVLPDRLVLLDLGIARDVTAAPSTTTRAGMSRGTPAYMAPERLLGQPATIASDVYELALVLVVMLLGTTPWPEGDATARFQPSLAGTPIPPEWIPVLEGALALDVARRPRSAAELVRALGAGPEGDARGLGLAATELVVSPPVAPQASAGAAIAPRQASTASDARFVASVPPRPAKRSRAVVAALALGVGGAAFGMWFLRARAPSDRDVGERSATAPSNRDDAPLGGGSRGAGPKEARGDGASIATAPSTRGDTPLGSASPGGPREAHSADGGLAPVPVSTSTSTLSPPCQQLVALMCSKTSGARPEECSTWRANADGWTRDLPPSVAASTCKSAYDASRVGLGHRRAAGAPPP